MPEPIQLKKQILQEEIRILQHYIEEGQKRPDTNQTYIKIELSQNKTYLAQKEFSLAEISKASDLLTKRKLLHESEAETLALQESLFAKNWKEFPLKEFLVKRIPNALESFTNCAPKAVVEIFIPKELKYAPNPTAKGFVRDATKAPSALIAWATGQQIGSMDYTYDTFLLVGTFSKMTCKTALIFGGGVVSALPSSALSRVSNYICEIPSRALTKLSRDFQDSKREQIKSLVNTTVPELNIDRLLDSEASKMLIEAMQQIHNLNIENINVVSLASDSIETLKPGRAVRFFKKNNFTHSTEALKDKYKFHQGEIDNLSNLITPQSETPLSDVEKTANEALYNGIEESIKLGVKDIVFSLVETTMHEIEKKELLHLYASLKTETAYFVIKSITAEIIRIAYESKVLKQDSEPSLNTKLIAKTTHEYHKSYITTKEQYDFLLEHLSYDILIDSVYASLIKTLTTDVLGTLLGIVTQTEFWIDPDRPSFSSIFVDKFLGRNIDAFQNTHHFIDGPLNSLLPQGYGRSFLKQFTKSYFETYALAPAARVVEDIPSTLRKSDFGKSDYISDKALHIIDKIPYMDTKKDYGMSDFMSNHTASMEDDFIALREESGKLGLPPHDEL